MNRCTMCGITQKILTYFIRGSTTVPQTWFEFKSADNVNINKAAETVNCPLKK